MQECFGLRDARLTLGPRLWGPMLPSLHREQQNGGAAPKPVLGQSCREKSPVAAAHNNT